MIKLFVQLTTPQGQRIQLGALVVSQPDSQGRLLGQFRYDPNYLESELAFFQWQKQHSNQKPVLN
jgi:hypothetical protein